MLKKKPKTESKVETKVKAKVEAKVESNNVQNTNKLGANLLIFPDGADGSYSVVVVVATKI